MPIIILLTIFSVFPFLSVSSAVEASACNSAYATDSCFIVNTLRNAPADADELYFARLFLGRPYVAHTLEVNDKEQLVVNTRELDCTTLIENVTALTLCAHRGEKTFQSFRRQLQQLRYYQGRLTDYTSRLHYFSEWIDDKSKMGLVSEVQQPTTVFTAVQTLNINYMSTHAKSYKALAAHPDFVPVIARQEQSLTGHKYRYIPKNEVVDSPALRQAIHDGDIIAITCSKPGLDIAHLGFAVWRKDGLHLLNASQLHKKVVEESMTLGEYLKKHPSHTGIRVVRIKIHNERVVQSPTLNGSFPPFAGTSLSVALTSLNPFANVYSVTPFLKMEISR